MGPSACYDGTPVEVMRVIYEHDHSGCDVWRHVNAVFIDDEDTGAAEDVPIRRLILIDDSEYDRGPD